MSHDNSTSGVASGLSAWIEDTTAALAFLTRLPVPGRAGRASAPTPRSLRAHPVAGAIVGAIGGLVAAVSLAIGLTDLLAATLAVAAMVLATGAFHEDALADTADGFGGGWSREQKLEIMRDSRLGSYGAVALIITLAVRIAAIAAIVDPDADWIAPVVLLAGTGALSRGMSVWLLHILPPARAEGLSSSAGTPDGGIATQGLVAALVLALLGAWIATDLTAALTAVIVSAIALWLMKRLAERQIGGQTGDVAGACQQVCEAAALVALVAVA